MIIKSSDPAARESGATADDQQSHVEAQEAAGPFPLPLEPLPHPFPFPIRVLLSGLYERNLPIRPIPDPIPIPIPIPHFPPDPIPVPGPIPGPGPFPGPGPIPTAPGAEVDGLEAGGESEAAFPLPFTPFPLFRREELRLDVDGRYPQMVASGNVPLGFARVSWIARLTRVTSTRFAGPIFYRHGATSSFPYTTVDISVSPSWVIGSQTATVTFTGGGATSTRTFNYKSAYFHPADFEFDFAAGEGAHTTVDTCAHPNRPATLGCETLTVENVFRRAGFDVTVSPGGSVPITGAGAGARWSDMEMHDAMQVYWSKFSATAQWAMWVFFASLHEDGTSLGGIMFDDIGPNHRQGTAIFNDAFISVPPAGDPAPAAWVQRMIFWTAVHEMGHAFNLAHSWQKALGTPWLAGLANEPEARSFMNYPFRVAGGQSAFFANFEYRFSNPELLFMRHAPSQFVQQGNAAWFDNHGFEEANVSPEPRLQLEVRANRDRAVFEFLEPVTLELKLTNVSNEPVLLDGDALRSMDSMVVIIKKAGSPAREFMPYAQRCYLPERSVLRPGESLYEPLPVYAGRNGWDISEPGSYVVQAALEHEGEDIVSAPLGVRVAPPRSYEEEELAQEVLTDDVGRVLSFRGSEALDGANKVLEEVVDRLEGRRVALHAALALGTKLSMEYKSLDEDPKSASGVGITARDPKPDESKSLLDRVFVAKGDEAAESLGHITFRRLAEGFGKWLSSQGDPQAAAKTLNATLDTLSAREVHGRKVRGEVLDELASQRDLYMATAKKDKK